jgi:hypothetical protein
MIARYRLEAYATLPEVVADKQARWRGVMGPVQAGSLCYFLEAYATFWKPMLLCGGVRIPTR